MNLKHSIVAALVILTGATFIASADEPNGYYEFNFSEYDFFGENSILVPLRYLVSCESAFGATLCVYLDMVPDGSGRYVGSGMFEFTGALDGTLIGPATGQTSCKYTDRPGAALCSKADFEITGARGYIEGLEAEIDMKIKGKVWQDLSYEGSGSVCVRVEVPGQGSVRECAGGLFWAQVVPQPWWLGLDVTQVGGGKLAGTATTSLGFDYTATGKYTASKDSATLSLKGLEGPSEGSKISMKGLRIDGPDIMDFVATYSVLGNSGTAVLWYPDRATTLFSGCQSDQLKVAAKLCKAEFSCWSKQAAKPDQDPAKHAACLDKAAAAFTKGYDKALAKAEQSGYCVVNGAAASVSGPTSSEIESLAGGVLQGTDTTNKTDNSLRAGLLKQAGALCSSHLAAFSADAKKPNPFKRDGSLEKAVTKFESAADKLVAKAASKGVSYDGISLGVLSEGARDISENLRDAQTDLVPYDIQQTSITRTGCKDPDDNGSHTYTGEADLTGTTPGEPFAGILTLTVDEGIVTEFGDMKGSISPGGDVTADLTYLGFDHTGRLAHSGTATCTGAVGGGGVVALQCTGQDVKGDSCSFNTSFDLEP